MVKWIRIAFPPKSVRTLFEVIWLAGASETTCYLLVWYRPPEVLLTSGMYGPEMDVWGAGCILFELTTLYPLFPGTNKADMINRIHKVLGTPSENVIAKLKPHASVDLRFSRQEGFGLKRLLPDATPECLDLLTQTSSLTFKIINKFIS